jgi:hypothetical protein
LHLRAGSVCAVSEAACAASRGFCPGHAVHGQRAGRSAARRDGAKGVLVAMARHQDTLGDQVQRMRQIADTRADGPALHAFVDAWLDYLLVVYPVAIQLETDSLSDADANASWQDRIFSQGMRMGLDRILGQIAAGGRLVADQEPSRLADLCLSLLVPSAWRYLVVERVGPLRPLHVRATC